jgi:hypothetical protein
VITAGGIDVDADGHDELLLLGDRLLSLVRFHPTPQVVDLREAIGPDDPRLACRAGAYAATDLDADGIIDLLVGCQSHDVPRGIEQQNIALRQTVDGEFVLLGDAYNPLRNDGVTLAIGVVDIDDDGLLDITLINDTFVKSGGASNHLATGAALFRCPPGADCTYTSTTFDDGDRAWGSFMGVGSVQISGAGSHLYITDWGANRLLGFAGRVPRDAAADHGITVAFSDSLPLFAWSVLVDDFDRNGLDDLLVTQGSASPTAFEGYAEHRDVLLLQGGAGEFTQHSDDVGLGPPTHEDSGVEARVYASRGAARVDLDGDGRLEFVVTGLEGVTKLYTELPTNDNAADRCTLLPRPRVVPGYGVGYAVRRSSDGIWHRRDMQGQPRFGSPSSILTSHARGQLRFPSGAIVPFDCSVGPHRLTVSEPDWIDVRADGAILVRLDTPWATDPIQVDVAIRDLHGQVRATVAQLRDDGVWWTPLRLGDDAAMIKIDGRWTARWWSL